MMASSTVEGQPASGAPVPGAAAAAATLPSPPSSHGLFGHAARTAAGAAPASRARVLCLLALAMCGYAVALLINGAASSLLPRRSSVAAVSLVADPLFVLSTFRAAAAAALCGCMAAWGDAPPRAAAPRLCDAHLLSAFLVGLTNCGGYAFYLALTSGVLGGDGVAVSSVAIWSALVGTYVVLPTAYGLAFQGEARTPRKLGGIAVCVVAGVLLGVSEAAVPAAGDAVAVRAGDAALFFACIGLWGLCDGLTAYVGRWLHPFYVCAASGAGFAVVALAAAATAVALQASAAQAGEAPPPPPPPAAVSAGAGYALMALGQALGVCAWYASVLLGRISEASAYLPILALYTCVTALLAVAVLGESLPATAWCGIAAAAAGMGLIATGGEAAPAVGAAVSGGLAGEDALAAAQRVSPLA